MDEVTQTRAETEVEVQVAQDVQDVEVVNESTGTETVEAKFTQADLDRLIGERLAREKAKAEKQAKEAEALAEKERLEETQQYKELYEKMQAEADAIRAEKEGLQRSMLLSRVAQEFGLPEEISSRLQGQSEDELRADAEKISALLAKPKLDKPSIQPDTLTRKSGVSEDERKILKEKFGIVMRGD